MRLKVFICIALAGISLWLYWPARHFDFVFYDDPAFVMEPAASAGLNWTGFKWVLTGVAAGNWHPVTNLSFLLMHYFYGFNPGADHLLNVFIHAANAVLLFLALVGLTERGVRSAECGMGKGAHEGGKLLSGELKDPVTKPDVSGSESQRLVTSSPTMTWMCAFVAGVFAWHPLRLESVAWIAERKDVLFVFFMLLCLWCYGKYAKCGMRNAECGMPESKGRHIYYGLALVFFALSLMSKAMVVTLPFLLLLLDFWPLGRFLIADWGSSFANLPSLKLRKSTATEDRLRSGPSPHPPSPRLRRTGPDPFHEPSSQSLSDSAGKSSPSPLPSPPGEGELSADALKRRMAKPIDSHNPSKKNRKQAPPDSGFRQESMQATVMRLVIEKIPFFALTIFFCALTFWVQNAHAAVQTLEKIGMGPRVENAILSYRHYLELFFWPNRTAVMHPYPTHFDTMEVVLTGLLLVAISAMCLAQIRRRPYLAMGWFWYLGTMVPVIGLVQVGIAAMADRYTYMTLIGPTMALTWLAADWAAGRIWARRLLSVVAVAIVAAGVISTEGQLKFWQNSETLFTRDLAVEPENLYGHFPMAFGLEQEGRWREAAVQYRIALILIRPDVLFISHVHLAGYDEAIGLHREASAQLEAALQLQPEAAETMNDLAWLLATCPDASVRDGNRAVELSQRACELTGYKQTMFMGTLAAAYAEAGRFDDAAATARKAIANAQQNGETDLAKRNQELLQLYLAHKAYREVETPKR